MARTQTLAQRLGKTSVFRNLPADQLKHLVASSGRIAVQPRQVIYEQGQDAGSSYVVLQGGVQFSVSIGRRHATAGLCFDHEVFGLEALQPRSRRAETAKAVSAGELLEIDNAVFKRLLLDNPRCQLDLLNHVVASLHEKTAHAVRNGHQDAEQRIAAYLIEQSGDRPPENGSRDASLSQAELADYLALTPETFCRKVNKFRQLGWIGGRGNEYIIKREEALKELLNR